MTVTTIDLHESLAIFQSNIYSAETVQVKFGKHSHELKMLTELTLILQILIQ